ncbi:unnamed protein product [Mycena citricolor]|uniref:DUF6534 domain-containing protein n=1 Tax=Mycena citricolor TaxID=2018698 RepID=A0AAD2H2G1_9AGAR|nr:unnamed protein product [Mycena citricolor]
MGETYDIPLTLGALLVGGSVALFLSGVVAVQCIIFFKLYPGEGVRSRAMVLSVWLLDSLHSAFIVTSLYIYFIRLFGDASKTLFIPWSIGLSVLVTALQTLIVHLYFARKIFRSSGGSWWITLPIVLLACCRLVAATYSTAEMIHLQRYTAFNDEYPGGIFTTGLSLSAVVDVLITGCLCYFLQRMRRRTASGPMSQMVNLLTLYTLENGLLTCLTTTASLICWLAMPNNLVFLGLHFIIEKLYANSLLISLNTRKELREMRWNKSGGTRWDKSVPVFTQDDFTVPYSQSQSGSSHHGYGHGANTELAMSKPHSAYRPASKLNPRTFPATLQVSVERSVRRTSADLSEYALAYASPYDERRRGRGAQRYQVHRPGSHEPLGDQLRSLP